MEFSGYYFIVAGIIAIIVELLLGVATGFDLFVIGILLIAGGIISLFSNVMIGGIIIAILTLAYVLFGRRIIHKSLSIETKKTNIDNIIGKTAMVIKSITSDCPGQVKIDGEVWRAESDIAIPQGVKVHIISVSGITLKVKQI